METRFYVALLVGLLIYLGAVSGLYLVFKPSFDYQKKKRKQMKEARRKALALAREAKNFEEEHTESSNESSIPSDQPKE